MDVPRGEDLRGLVASNVADDLVRGHILFVLHRGGEEARSSADRGRLQRRRRRGGREMKKDGRGRRPTDRRVELALSLAGIGTTFWRWGKTAGKSRPTGGRCCKKRDREVGGAGEAPLPVYDLMMAQSIDNGARYTRITMISEGHAN